MSLIHSVNIRDLHMFNDKYIHTLRIIVDTSCNNLHDFTLPSNIEEILFLFDYANFNVLTKEDVTRHKEFQDIFINDIITKKSRASKFEVCNIICDIPFTKDDKCSVM